MNVYDVFYYYFVKKTKQYIHTDVNWPKSPNHVAKYSETFDPHQRKSVNGKLNYFLKKIIISVQQTWQEEFTH